MGELIAEPWPWYVAGPLIGLVVPLLLWAGGEFVVSENLRHICAAALPIQNKFFRYDWKSNGLWNRTFALGIVLGAAVSRVGNLWPYDRAGQSTGQSIDPTTAARAPRDRAQSSTHHSALPRRRAPGRSSGPYCRTNARDRDGTG